MVYGVCVWTTKRLKYPVGHATTVTLIFQVKLLATQKEKRKIRKKNKKKIKTNNFFFFLKIKCAYMQSLTGPVEYLYSH